MRVLYVSPYPPMRDGIGSYTKTLADAVRDAGNEIGVVAPRILAGAPPEVIGLVAPAGPRFTKLHRAVAKWAPDIVHIQFAIAAFGTRAIALMRWLDLFRRRLRIPVIITLHETTRESALLPGTGPVISRWIAAHCDQLIVHTEIARDMLAEIGIPECSISVIPQPKVHLPAATASPGDLRARFGLGGARILLAFGFIHADKGLDDLIEALDILRGTRPALLDGVRLLVAGAVRPRDGLFRVFEARDNLYLARMLRRVRRNELQDLVVLTGYVPEGEISAWFETAEAVVLPYRSIEHSMVAGFARSAGVPVLSSTAGGLREQFAGSQWTFPPCSPSRIAQTLEDFLTATPGQRKRVPQVHGTDDFGAVVAETLELYRVAASRTPGRSSYVP